MCKLQIELACLFQQIVTEPHATRVSHTVLIINHDG